MFKRELTAAIAELPKLETLAMAVLLLAAVALYWAQPALL